MYTPLPSSGIGGGRLTVGGAGRLSDRELMSNVSDTAVLQQMLRNTPFAGRSMGPGVPIALPASLIRAMGRPGRVPSVVRAARNARKLINLSGGPLGSPDIEPLDAASPRRNSNGVPVMSGLVNIGACGANHGPYSGKYAATGPSNPACGVGFTQSQDFTEAFTQVSKTLNACLQVLSTMNGIGSPPGKRRRETWQNQSLSTRKFVRQTVSSPSQRRGASLSNRKMSSTQRRRRVDDYTPGYRRKAVELSVKADANGNIRGDGPPVQVTHREVPTKTEKKSREKVGALIGAYHKLTEINDLVDALADAIPGKPCKGLPGFRKMVCVVNNWDRIDPFNAAANVLVNEIEDRIVGRLQGKLSDVLKKAGGPNSTQVQQFVRQLQMMGVV